MPYRQIAEAALAEWRVAEQVLETHPEGSPEWRLAAALVEDARARYQQAIEDARATHSPESTPFDELSALT
jgi:hypothetical protein